MCLINFQVNDHPNYKLIIAANRDEFYERPTAPAQFWDEEPNILAGQDLLQKGTWLGISKNGRFAALTNYRDPDHMKKGELSRGEIVKDYLTADQSPEEHLQHLKERRKDYVGFNVLFGTPDRLFHYNNVLEETTEIEPGTHGLSNATLNTPWPKVIKGKKQLREYVEGQNKMDPAQLFSIVADAEEADDSSLPETGIGLELERKLSSLFIKTPEYGTRSSTVLLVDKQNNVTFLERTFSKGEFKDEKRFDFKIS
ncbi:NRDE family protein [Virgibacillus oceani]